MEKIFSKDRMLLLARSIFVQNKSKDLRIALVVGGIMAFFGLLSSLHGVHELLGFVNMVVLLVLAGTTYKMMANQPQAMAYLTLPASSAEKAVVTIAYLNVYYLILLIVSSFAGFYIGQMLQNLIILIPFFQELFHVAEGESFSLSSVSFEEFGSNLWALTMGVSVFLFGSLYFRRYAMLKTILVGLGFITAFFIIDITIIAGATHAYNLSAYDIDVPNIPEWLEAVMDYLIPSLIILFFWFMTYLRLRETEA